MFTPWSCIVIILLSLSARLRSPAYAESAWVLWTAHHASQKTYWQWEDAFAGRVPCLQVLDRKQKAFGRDRAHRTSEAIVVVDPAAGVLGEGFEYHCLPETVDPRWPKGK